MADRVLLDTNIFITGYRRPDSLEGQVLKELSNRSELTLVLYLISLQVDRATAACLRSR